MIKKPVPPFRRPSAPAPDKAEEYLPSWPSPKTGVAACKQNHLTGGERDRLVRGGRDCNYRPGIITTIRPTNPLASAIFLVLHSDRCANSIVRASITHAWERPGNIKTKAGRSQPPLRGGRESPAERGYSKGSAGWLTARSIPRSQSW